MSTSSRATRPARVGREQLVGHVDVARRVEAAYGDADQLDRRADPRGQVVGLLVQQPHHLDPTDAAAQQRHLQVRLSPAHRHTHVGRQQVLLGLPCAARPRVFPSRTAITGGRSTWL